MSLKIMRSRHGAARCYSTAYIYANSAAIQQQREGERHATGARLYESDSGMRVSGVTAVARGCYANEIRSMA